MGERELLCSPPPEEDREFFSRYRERFLEETREVLKELGIHPEVEKVVMQTAGEVYNALFLDPDGWRRLENLIERVLYYDLSLRAIFVKPYLEAVRAYAEYILSKCSTTSADPIARIKRIFQLLGEFFDTVERVYNRLLQEREQKLKERFNEELEKERREKLALEKQTIYHLLTRIKDRGEPIELRLYYKGIPVFCKAKVQAVEPSLDFLHLRGERCKYKPFFLKGQKLFLKHPDLPKPVAAIVREGDPRSGSIVLTGLYFEELPHEKRRTVRVEPEKPVDIKLINGKTVYRGMVKDVSPQGVGVIFEELPPLEVGSYVSLKTSIGGVDIDTTADVRYIDRETGRVGFHFVLPPEQERKLSRYILKRQMEILKEIRLDV